MTLVEAQKIFRNWQVHLELFDKLRTIFTVFPESFLPYPVSVLEEALNIVAKDFYERGDTSAAADIQRLMAYHIGGLYLDEKMLDDEQALLEMKRRLDLIFSDEELKKVLLMNLKRVRDSWANSKTAEHLQNEN